MYKVTRPLAVIAITLLAVSCSIFRKSSSEVASYDAVTFDAGMVMSDVTGNNFTHRGFEIRKSKVEIDLGDIRGKLSLHARLNSAGDFYGSVRGPLGIELARLLIVDDKVAAIDRINRTVYTGTKSDLLRKNGLPSDFFMILFGDMPLIKYEEYLLDEPYSVTFFSRDRESEREIDISLPEMKVTRQKIELPGSGSQVNLSFGKFVPVSGIKYGSEIIFNETKRMFHVKLNIDDLVYGYDSDIEFSLPSYKQQAL